MSKPEPFSKCIQPAQKFIYTQTLSVRISDVNYANHLAATAVPPMLHQVRLKFLTSQGFSESKIGGVGLMVTDLYLHYQCESFFDNQLLFQLGVESIAKCNAVLIYQIYNQTLDKPMGVAKERIVFFDRELRKIAKTPKIFMATVQKLEEER